MTVIFNNNLPLTSWSYFFFGGFVGFSSSITSGFITIFIDLL